MGEVTGTEVQTINPCSGDQGFVGQTSDGEFNWDDNEELMYREWMKEQQENREQDAEWSEFEKEEEYRRRLQEEAAERGGEEVNWEDDRERAYREKYMNMRIAGAKVTWDCSSEREAMEKSRRRSEMRKK